METKIVDVRNVKEIHFAEENIYGRPLCRTLHCNVVYARIEGEQSQAHHLQNRPDNGDELMFFFMGTFLLRRKDETTGPMTATSSRPIFVLVKSGEELSVVNLSSDDLEYLTMHAPPYSEGEIVFCAVEK